MDLLTKIDLNNTPKHIAIIMDGNGRWAKKQGEMRLHGHNTGVESVREVLKAAQKLKVEYLTLYAFSMENWNRPKEEVDGLMDLLVRTIAGEVNELHGSGVRMLAIGDIDGLPGDCNVELRQAMDKTKNNTDINLVLALNYSARSEMVNATKNIAEMVKNGEMTLDQIDDEVFSNHLTTKGIPDPELLIRTSGEYRISNFLLWQIAYSELHFTPVLWPDFKKEDLYKAVIDYQSRERRFGMVSEQISKSL
jgi:undecaprenyl diphosphate synthase|tara:strand:+ start:12860 stop:13609 length:750 start_codon:yes stop_codon:yes gene_type:complete